MAKAKTGRKTPKATTTRAKKAPAKKKPAAKAKPKPAPKKRSKAEAARENGKRGGRPKKELYLEDFDGIGDPPLGKPLAIAGYVQSILAIDMKRMITGRANPALSASLRTTGRAISQSVPMDAIAEAQRLMDIEAGNLEPGAGPEEVDADGLEEHGEERPTSSISG